MEATAGRPLGWFFEQWFWRPGFAELTVSWRHDPAKQRVVLDVEQGTRFAAYRVKMAVDLVAPDGSVRRSLVDIPAQQRATVEVPLSTPQAPTRVVLDPDVGVLGTITPSR
ncbi:MAG: hypothetical protein ACT4P6_16740 [Gemmatimonadaceae bacterium]